ncbi:pulmonary surfactant-associated protein C-like [Hemicordylus capensis]|uniref:pulmonary surfactant-associated protein C-like n=1 Tax=Hemicordylus capensis TaxID=884348 RepID=UPI002302DB1E|nr:pulmonary surfactant-associated protein C-like [Hemicordylus capensis]
MTVVMELNGKMDAAAKYPLSQHPYGQDPEFGSCCPCCDCCPGCPGCGSCPNLCCCCPSCCCPPSCACCCRLCCCLPQLLCKLPKFAGCPINIKRPLIILVVIVLVVVIIVGVLLMGLHITQAHTETVLQMTIDGLEGAGSQLNLAMEMEGAATFHVEDGTNDPATVIYDFNRLLMAYKPWHRQACYIARMDKGNMPGLDAVLQEFQTKLSITPPVLREEEALRASVVDRSLMGATINILCSRVPIFWA